MSGIALPTNEKHHEESDGCWKCPDFKVSGVFSSHMVLQRDRPIRIWGFSCNTGSKVTGNFGGEVSSATVTDDHSWCLTFAPRSVSKEPASLHICDDCGHEALFDDILIGDVWLLGGQSNMETTIAHSIAYFPDLQFEENDRFRLFTQVQEYAERHHTEFCAAPQRDVIHPDWKWKRPGKEASLEFSALGYFFAKELTQNVDIPMGLIMACAGGAALRELIPEELAHELGYYYGANVREAGYYNSLIAPFVGLPFRAQLFFQGESESMDLELSERYAEDLRRLVLDERQRFGFDFPFYNVQLSSYGEIGSPEFVYTNIIRDQQMRARDVIDKYYLVVDMDLGSPDGWEDWAHSPRKQELASRLVRLVLCKEYGILEPEYASSPMPVSAIGCADGKHVDVRFDCVAGGLRTANGALDVTGFRAGGKDDMVPVPAVITAPDTVSLDVSALPSTGVQAISYAYDTLILPETADLLNGIGYPAGTFMLPVQ